jgi:hypothetical protein
MVSSVLTLTSNTTSSSASSPNNRADDTLNAVSAQLKKLYRELTALENKLAKEDYEEENKVVLKSRSSPQATQDEKLLKMIADHKL